MRRMLFIADADYLQAALDQIEREHGGLEPYLKASVQVGPQVLQRVRDSLLT